MAENKSPSGMGEQFEQYRQRVMDSDAVRNVMSSDAVKTLQERIQTQGPDLVERVKSLAGEAMVRRISIQQEGRTIFEFPLAVGLGGALLAPQLAALGALAALVTNCTITVEREDASGQSGDSATGSSTAKSDEKSSSTRSPAGASSGGGGGYGSSVGGTDQTRSTST